MAEKLQLKHLLTIIFIPIICFSVAKHSYGQVSLTATESFEVLFVADETRNTETTREIGMNDLDLNNILGEEGSNVSMFTDQSDLQNGYYFVDMGNSLSIGRYYNRDTAELVSLTLKNDTDTNISELSVAFDFIFIPVEQEQNFELSYRVNNGRWKQPASGTFSTDYLQSTVDGWNPFSIQLTLDELFIRTDDTFEFRWTTSLDDTDGFLPIALQRVALNSVEASQQEVTPGSLVISEILAGYEQQDRAIEYVELFNTTENPISLKGMTLKSGDREIVIQNNIVVPPYEAAVIGNNRNFTEIPVRFNYQYNGSLLPERGRLDILAGDIIVAGAMYESTEPGVALEMSHLSNGRNGYSSMRSFEESVTEISPSVFGSPGKVDESKRIYQKTISDEGWHFVFPLGDLHEPDRNLRSSVYGVAENLELSNSGNSNFLATESFFVHVNKDLPVTLYSDGSSTSTGVQPKSDQANQLPFKLLGNPLPNSIGIDQVVNDNKTQAFPAVMVWEPSTQKFNVVFKEDDFIDPWSGIILPRSDEHEVSFLENIEESKSSFLDNYISLSLLEEGDGSSYHNVDEGAIVGFAENRNILEDIKTDLPKLKLEDDEGIFDQSFVYLRSSTSDFETNSFLQFPIRFEEPYQIGVGVNLARGNHNYRLSWNSLANLPEEWVIELVDVDSDQVIDMREESHYTFRSTNITEEDGMNVDGKFLKTVENNSSKNLFIRVSPHTMVEESTTETEKPKTVNLKQNYPNPFNPTTTISFYLPENSFVRLAVYNVVGQQVAMLREENISGGDHSVTWNASEMPSGIYIVKLETQQNVLTRKITLIK